MKKSIKNIVAGVLLSSTLGMTACFGGGDPTVKSVEINNRGSNSYLVYDSFDPSNYVLNVSMSDGSTKTVNITSDMIVEAPDMSTAGQKTFKVEYQGKVYELTINVGGYSKQDMLEKIQAFMTDYNAQTNAGSLKVNVTGGYQAKYLDQFASGQIPANALEAVMQQSDFSGDTLLKHLYSSVVGSLTESTSNNVTLENIVNSNNLHSKVEVIKVLETLAQRVSNFNYASYILNTFMNSEGYHELINTITDEIAISYNFVGDNAKTELKSFINVTLRDFVRFVEDLDKENSQATFDVMEIIHDFNNLVQEYSDEEFTKTTLQTIVDALDEKDPHVLSNFFKALADNELPILGLYHWEWNDSVGDFIAVYVDNAETKVINKDVATKLSTLVRTYEDIVLNFFEEVPQDYEELMAKLADDMESFALSLESIYDTDYECDGALTIASHVRILSDTIRNYQNSDSYVEFIVDELRIIYIPEIATMMVMNLFDEEAFSEDVYYALGDCIYYLLNDVLDAVKDGQLVLDKDEYLDNIITLLGNEAIDSVKKTEYEAEWEETGFCSIISDFIYEQLEGAELETEVKEMIEDMIGAIEYLEDSLRTSGEEKIDFSLVELFAKINAIADKACNYTQSEIARVEEERDNYVPEEPVPGQLVEIKDFEAQLEILNSQYMLFECISKLTDYENKELNGLQFLNNFSNSMSIIADHFKDQIDNISNNDPLAPTSDGTFSDLDSIGNRIHYLQSQYDTFHVLSVLTDFNDEGNTFRGNVDKIIAEYKAYIKEMLTTIGTGLLGVQQYSYMEMWDENLQDFVAVNPVLRPEYTAARAEVALLADYVVEKYIDNKLDVNYVVSWYFDIINDHAHESVKVLTTASSLIAMVTMDKLTSEQIDYNELFSFITLPEEIESIDYNKLVETFWSETTYQNMFSVSKVDVKYETNSQGNIAREIMEVTLSFDYDLKITSLSADLTLKFTVDF